MSGQQPPPESYQQDNDDSDVSDLDAPVRAGHEDDDDEDGNPQDAGTPGSAEAKAKTRPNVYKSAESRARDERMTANFALYQHKTDEELIEILPKNANGKPSSIGAMLHDGGGCGVCIFHHTEKGCHNAMRCKFCHGDHEKPEKKKRRKNRGEGGDGGQDGAQQGQGGGKRGRRRGGGGCQDGDLEDRPPASMVPYGLPRWDPYGPLPPHGYYPPPGHPPLQHGYYPPPGYPPPPPPASSHGAYPPAPYGSYPPAPYGHYPPPAYAGYSLPSQGCYPPAPGYAQPSQSGCGYPPPPEQGGYPPSVAGYAPSLHGGGADHGYPPTGYPSGPYDGRERQAYDAVPGPTGNPYGNPYADGRASLPQVRPGSAAVPARAGGQERSRSRRRRRPSG